MKKINLISFFVFISALLFLIGCNRCKEETETAAFNKKSVNELIDKFHKAASKADEKEYFGCMSAGSYYLGTASEELWTKEEFRAYCKPYFSKGRGWTYTPKDRQVSFSVDGKNAWFFERLFNDRYGELRGSGILTLEEGGWKISQYNMAFVVPNNVSGKVVEIIKTPVKAEKETDGE
ncbi:nuclear transport factor 2 family protein [Acidobacteriota bacterium]